MANPPSVVDNSLAVLRLETLASSVLFGSAGSLPGAGVGTEVFQMEGRTPSGAASPRRRPLVPGRGEGALGGARRVRSFRVPSEAAYDLSLPPTPPHQEQHTVKCLSLSPPVSLSLVLSRSRRPGAAVMVLGLFP